MGYPGRGALDTDAVLAPTMPTATADPMRRVALPEPLPAAAARNASPTRPVRDPRIRATVIAAVGFVALGVGLVLVARWLRVLESVQGLLGFYPG